MIKMSNAFTGGCAMWLAVVVREEGAADYLLKSFSSDDFHRAASKAIRWSGCMNGNTALGLWPVGRPSRSFLRRNSWANKPWARFLFVLLQHQ